MTLILALTPNNPTGNLELCISNLGGVPGRGVAEGGNKRPDDDDDAYACVCFKYLAYLVSAVYAGMLFIALRIYVSACLRACCCMLERACVRVCGGSLGARQGLVVMVMEIRNYIPSGNPSSRPKGRP